MSNHPAASNGSYELYDGTSVHQGPLVASLENELLSPPGGPTFHPPPPSAHIRKQMEQMQQDLIRNRKEKEHLMNENEELRRKSGYNNISDTRYIAEASADLEDVKDATIRQLQRKVTILQADLYKKEGLEHRMMELTKEKNLMDDKCHSMAVECDANKTEIWHLQRQIQDLKGMLSQKQEEIDRLTQDKRSDKTRLSQLEKESRDSSSPSASSSSSQANSASLGSILSNPNYSKELEYLHKMVDALKSTVLEQRRVFQKMGLQSRPFNSMPQTQPNAPPARNGNMTQSCNNISTTHTASLATPSAMTMTARPLRQAEENSEATPSSAGGNVSDTSSQATASDLVSGTRELNLNAGNVKCENNDNDIYMNVKGLGLVNIHPKESGNLRKNSPPLGNQQDIHQSYSNEKSSPRMRKPSNTEIINRRPQLLDGVSVPVKSQTEIISIKSPNNLDHHQRKDYNVLSHRMGIAPEAEIIRPQFPPEIPAVTDPKLLVSGPRFVGGEPKPIQGIHSPNTWPQATSSQPTQQQLPQRWAATVPQSGNNLYAPPNHSNTSSNISDLTINPPTSAQRMVRPQDDRLCPVCNQHYGHISMEEFQTHVFDCFDSDNGPETLQAEMAADFPPPAAPQGRTCPMCQRKFEIFVSQTEFEQHVHQHFEEPFEELS